ncbi:hypothetical protein [Microbacterium sp. HJ5]
MPKQLITLLGLIISVGVVALGFFVVALPTLLQSQSVDAQTTSVAADNAVYQAQVDSLSEAAERQSEIDASVAALRGQIPATNQFDDVFEVIGRAATVANVSIVSAAAGEVTPFMPRTAEVAAADPDETTAAEAAEESVAVDGRAQAAFAIDVSAPDMASATRFLDELGEGPRLLSTITVSAAGAGVVDLQIQALTYIDSEG